MILALTLIISQMELKALDVISRVFLLTTHGKFPNTKVKLSKRNGALWGCHQSPKCIHFCRCRFVHM